MEKKYTQEQLIKIKESNDNAGWCNVYISEKLIFLSAADNCCPLLRFKTEKIIYNTDKYRYTQCLATGIFVRTWLESGYFLRQGKQGQSQQQTSGTGTNCFCLSIERFGFNLFVCLRSFRVPMFQFYPARDDGVQCALVLDT